MPTQAERSATTTKSLRQAARRLFGRRGFESVSVDDIAAAAGVTRGAFYHHYDSKEELFEVVFVEIQTMLLDHVRDDPYPSTTMLDMIERLLQPDDVDDYTGILIDKVSQDSFPSMDQLRRLMAFA